MTETFTIPPTWRWLDRPPLGLDTGLKGHVLVVLYWRLGCVHSRVALHELTMALTEFADEPVTVICVHVATCDEERDEDRLRRWVQTSPAPVTVAIQPQVSGERLPSMLLVDAECAVRVRAVGVPRRSSMRAAVQALLTEARRAGLAAKVPFVPAALPASSAWLPIAVACDGERIWVASAGRRQVLGFEQDGSVAMVVGSGEPGAEDGEAALASFSLPSSLGIHDEYLVVADSHSHTLRAIDRSTGEVRTWCGTGRLGHDEMGGSYGRDQALSSPAGMVSRDGGLFVCQAGTNQLWQIDPMTGSAMAWLGGEVADYGGDSFSAGQDGAAGESFSEPIGLADDEDTLWVVEGRGHTLSAVDLAHVQRRTVYAGFRRPVAVVLHGDRVLVADAFQATVFAVTASDGQAVPLLGPDHGLVEPVSLAMHGDRLLIADMGADAVFVCDLAADQVKLSRLPVTGIPERVVSAAGPAALVAQAQELREHSDVSIRIDTPGHDDGIEAVVDVVDEGTQLLACDRHEATLVKGSMVTVLLPVEGPGVGALRIRLRLGGVTTHYVMPATATASGELEATLVLPTG